MPGISLLNSDDAIGNSSFDQSLDSLLFFNEYEKTVSWCEECTAVGYTGYRSYPVTTYETPEFVATFEGHLYDIADERETIHTVGEKVLSNDIKWLRGWLLDRDAEFILVVVEKATGDTFVLNDPLARLPVYTYVRDQTIYFSREISFILDNEDIEPDSMGIAQYLLFGYPLGDRTLYKDVKQVPPASLLRLSEGQMEYERLYQIEIGEKAHSDKTLEENSSKLSEKIVTSTRRRSGNGTNIVSLSGGLDSRAIAACMTAENVQYRSATYTTGTEKTKSEATAAESVMAILGEDWVEYELQGSSPEFRNQLLKLKRGMNVVKMSYILEFFEKLKSDYGDQITYFTGDGGAKLSSWTPPRNFKNDSGIVDYLLADQTRIPLDQVADLSVHSRKEIKSSIYDRLRSYPEQEPSQRYVHFLIRERSLKWGYHGEDRNRYYFWSVAPLYSFPIFDYAMSVPDSQKKQNKLYTNVISSFSKRVLNVPYSNYNAPVGSLEYKIKSKMYQLAARAPTIREKLIQHLIRSGQKVDQDTLQLIRDHSTGIREYPDSISVSNIDDITSDGDPALKGDVNYLATVVLALNSIS